MQSREITEQQIIDTFLPFAPEKVIIFGSHARGESDEFSDIDLIIVLKTSKRFMERLRDLYMAWNFPRAVDILAYTPEEFEEMLRENSFIQDAVAQGKLIHERSH